MQSAARWCYERPSHTAYIRKLCTGHVHNLVMMGLSSSSDRDAGGRVLDPCSGATPMLSMTYCEHLSVDSCTQDGESKS